MLEVQNLSYSTKTFSMENVSFSLDDGYLMTLLGRNGAGKTTLLRIIAGIMEPTSGSVSIDNMNYKENQTAIKQKIAFMSGNTKLYKDMSAYELLKMFGQYYKVPDKELEKRIKKTAKRFELTPFLHQRIETLSTGQTQRVSISRCTIHDPEYYIFDEATSGLDIISSKIILDFIKEEKQQGKCILYSTHYMEEAENICDRVILIHHGKIIKEGTPKNIVKETKTTNLRDAFFCLIEGEKNE